MGSDCCATQAWKVPGGALPVLASSTRATGTPITDIVTPAMPRARPDQNRRPREPRCVLSDDCPRAGVAASNAIRQATPALMGASGAYPTHVGGEKREPKYDGRAAHSNHCERDDHAGHAPR